MVHCVEGFRQVHVDACHVFAVVHSVQNVVNYFDQSQGCWVPLSESQLVVTQNFVSFQEFWELFVHNLLHYFIDGAEQTDWPVIAWVFPCVFFLKIGTTLASFSFDGTVPLSKERLIMWVIRGENSIAFSFTIFGCILSSPQDFFPFNFINSLYTSLVSAGLRKKLHWLQSYCHFLYF